MARMIKCPRCQSQIDVTNVVGGSTVPCGDCGVMLRVPTGQTGMRPAVPAPAPEPVAAAAAGSRLRERQTPIFRKMAGSRSPAERKGPSRAAGERPMARRGKGSSPAIGIVCAVLCIGLIGLLVFAMTSKRGQMSAKERETAEKLEQRRKDAAEKNEANRRIEKELQAEEDRKAAEAAARGEKPKPGQLARKSTGEYDIPPAFESGAQKVAEKHSKGTFQDVQVDPNLKKEYEGLASAGRVDDIVKEDSKWMACIISSLLSDDEKICRATFRALAGICDKHKISSKEERFENPVKLEFFNSAYIRGGDYLFWSEWWGKDQNKAAVRQWGTGVEVSGEDPRSVKWDDLVKDLRAGGYDDPDHPGGRAVARIKLMGKDAYPHLVKYIDHEDIMIGKAIVAVLNDLTKQQRPIPTEATKAQLKAEWESWVKKN